jgi:transposase InsO family protein
MLAVVYYLKHFRQYLLGKKFRIRTDHAALQWIRRTPEPIGQQARWAQIMEEYDFEIEHRAGKSHLNADAMSRKPACRQCVFHDEYNDKVLNMRAVSFEEPEIGALSREELVKATETDVELREIMELLQREQSPSNEEMNAYGSTTKTYWRQRERLKIKEGLLYRYWYHTDGITGTWQLIVPRAFRTEIIKLVHQGLNGGHYGYRRTKLKLQFKAYWINYNRDVETYCRQCDVCARYFRGKLPRTGHLQPMKMGEPFERISIDITGPHVISNRQNKYILTVVDFFSKYAFAFPIRNHEAHTVADKLMDNVFTLVGVPRQILSDQGPEFESSLMKELCTILNIQKLRTSAYKPSTNSQAERFHKSLNTIMAKLVSDNQRDWCKRLPYAIAAYNSTVHSATGYTPNYIIFGRESRAPVDLTLGTPEEVRPLSTNEFVEKKTEVMEDTYRLVRINLQKAANVAKDRYDLKVKPKEINPGDFALLRSAL